MSTLFAVRALLFAGECFAASLVLLALARIASVFVKQAAMRHFVWLTAFGVLLVLPAVALIVPPRITITREADAPKAIPAYVEYSVPTSASVAVDAMPEPAVAPTPAPSFHPGTRKIAIGLFALWLAGFLFALTRIVRALIGLQILRRASRPHTLTYADLPFTGASRRECELRISNRDDGPMAWGIFRPVILLPGNARAWPRERLQAVLLHELAHVRRRDGLMQMLSLLACAIYWFNPLMWIGARALRREAEIAADDAVIVSGIKPSAYAGELLQLAAQFNGRRAVASVAMAAPSSLETRVKSVLALNNVRKGVTPMDALKVALLGAAATALIAVARPDVVEAQDAVAPPPAPVAAPSDLPPVDAIPTVPDVPPAPPAPPAPHHHHVHSVQSAEADSADPAPLPAPAALPAPPAPPPPPAVHALPPVPPVPAIVDSENDEDATADIDDDEGADAKGDRNVKVRVWTDKDGRRHETRTVRTLSPAEKAHIDKEVARAQEEARRAGAEIQRMQPEIEKALAAAKVNEKVARAMREVEPRIRAEINKAMAEARPEIRAAIAEAHISEKVMKAIHDAQPKIDEAMRRANEAERRVRVTHTDNGHISVHVDRDDDNDDEDDDGK